MPRNNSRVHYPRNAAERKRLGLTCSIDITPHLTKEEVKLLRAYAKQAKMPLSAFLTKIAMQGLAEHKMLKAREVRKLEKLHRLE